MGTKQEIGWEKLKEVDGEAGEAVFEALNGISPELSGFIVGYAFGEVYSRTGTSLRSKEIAAVAALTALGTCGPQLRVHLNGALNVGCTLSEVKEVILQMASYAGFPAAINAMMTLKEVAADRKKAGKSDSGGRLPTSRPVGDRYRDGVRELSLLDPDQAARLEESFGEFCPGLVKAVVEFGYSDLYSRDNLSRPDRQTATIAALTALGNARPQLKFHIQAGLNGGLSADEVKEIILLMTVYAGFPAAINAMMVLKEVVAGGESPVPVSGA